MYIGLDGEVGAKGWKKEKGVDGARANTHGNQDRRNRRVMSCGRAPKGRDAQLSEAHQKKPEATSGRA